jgi:hypothetical protein
VYPNRTDLGYAASRSAEFGLSSAGEPAAILHPSKTEKKILNFVKISRLVNRNTRLALESRRIPCDSLAMSAIEEMAFTLWKGTGIKV